MNKIHTDLNTPLTFLQIPVEPYEIEKNPFIDPVGLKEEMKEVLIAHHGYGLSAPQIGYPFRAIMFGDWRNPKTFQLALNPKIVDMSDDIELFEEGSLSFPHLYVPIKRPVSIRVRFTDEAGNVDTVKYTGLTARIIQHQVGVLDGELFYNKASRFHRDRAFRKRKSALRKA